ncbi:hypothetical protein ACOZ38_25445 [Sphaerisporangium viridialbum]|uniref:hypothetical protein n=1 Tax=Sphaerisporangium viridialbum TaxID=46189 RepID=UPI003C7457CA
MSRRRVPPGEPVEVDGQIVGHQQMLPDEPPPEQEAPAVTARRKRNRYQGKEVGEDA